MLEADSPSKNPAFVKMSLHAAAGGMTSDWFSNCMMFFMNVKLTFQSPRLVSVGILLRLFGIP
jgi:hypothetical protein